MSFLRPVIDSLLSTWERLKGDRGMAVVDVHQDPLEGYKVYVNGGVSVEIFCRELRYRLTHEAWWYPVRHITMYHVYSHHSSDVSQALAQKLKESFTITPLLPWGASRKDQKKAAIAAYVELMLNHFRTLKG